MPGGVCAVLNYEVDRMAEYVAEMTIRILNPQSLNHSNFRKFVSQILSSTRLPSTTILLGMNYLAKRVNIMNTNGPTNVNEGQVWRMLTVALLLGSKFLDDNTFQNRSWAEVSGIAVSELNALENDWLRAISWRLYVNLDKSEDYNAWLNNWKEWQENKKRQQAHSSRERLASLVIPEPEAPRQRNTAYSTWHQQQQQEYERLSSIKRAEQAAQQQPQQQPYRTRENWQPPQAQQPIFNNPWSAPLTPPDSGYGTPEYINSATSTTSRYGDWYNQTAAQNNYARSYLQPNHANHSYARSNSTAYSANYHYNSSWDPNVAECNCMNCSGPMPSKQPYFATHSFGQQPVMG